MGGWKGLYAMRVDGKLLPVRPFPRIDRFKEHTIELPVGYVKVNPRSEKELRERLSKALEFGKGVVHVQTGKDLQVFSTKRACRSCGPKLSELDPRLFSYNSKHGWCAACSDRAQHRGGRMERRAARAPARRTTCSTRGSSGWKSTRLARNARASGSTPEALARALAREVDRRTIPLRRIPRSQESIRWKESQGARSRDSPRDLVPELKIAPSGFLAKWDWLSHPRSAGADASPAARRSASGSRRNWAPTCAACATSSTKPSDRPAPPR